MPPPTLCLYFILLVGDPDFKSTFLLWQRNGESSLGLNRHKFPGIFITFEFEGLLLFTMA